MIYGLYLEGASWDSGKDTIVDDKGELLCEMPVIILEGIKLTQQDVYRAGFRKYNCPVYMTGARGALNYITNIELPTEKTENYWVL